MMGKVQLLPDALPSHRAAFASIPELQVSTGPQQFVELDGTRRRMEILELPGDPSGLTHWANANVEDSDRGDGGGAGVRWSNNTVRVVVAQALTKAERESIENVHLSWCEARGAVHLSWPGVFCHIDRTGRVPGSSNKGSRSGVGVTTIRGVQTLLEAPGDSPWTVAMLANKAAMSTGQAAAVLAMLEDERFLRSEGSGPKRRRYVRDREGVLNWLVAVERNRRRPESAASYLYARTFDDLIDRFAKRAAGSGLSYALTSNAGAIALGHRLMSNPIVLQVRVGPVPAAHALALLGLEQLDAEDAGRGMNVDLWTDVGELGTFGATTATDRPIPIRVAPRVRIWLDMVRLGGREADAAALFKEQALV